MLTMSKAVVLSPARIAVLAAVIIGTGIALFAAAAVQQNERQSANDPQIQLAQDAASALSAGHSTQSVVGGAVPLNMSQSLAPFIIVTGSRGQTLAAGATFNGSVIIPPTGALTPDHRFTWQPASNVRLAAVVERYNGGYVIAARNLREVERREDDLRLMALLSLVGVAAVGAVAWLMLR